MRALAARLLGSRLEYTTATSTRTLEIVARELRVTVRSLAGPAYLPAYADQLRDEADVLVVVLDSQSERTEANQAALELVLASSRAAVSRPVVIQLNKRDLPSARPMSELVRLLGLEAAQIYESVAVRDHGVWEPFAMAVALGARARGFEDVARRWLATVVGRSR